MAHSSYKVSPKAQKMIQRMLERGGSAYVLHRDTVRERGPKGGPEWVDVLHLSIPGEQFDVEDCIELAWVPF